MRCDCLREYNIFNMKKIIIALVLVAGVGTLVYQSAQNAKLSKAEDNQAGVLLAAGPSGGDTSTADYVGGASLDDSSTKPAKPGCRNTLACNRDETATTDGGVCEYAFWSRGMDLTGKLLFDGLAEEVFDPIRQKYGGDVPITNEMWQELEEGYNRFLLAKNEDEGQLQKILNDKSILKYRCAANANCSTLSITSWTMPASFLVTNSTVDANDTRKVNLVGYASEKTVASLNGTKACDSAQYKKIKKDAEQEVAKPKKADSPKAKPVNSKVRR